MTRSGLLSAALLFSICIQPAPATAQPVLSVQSDIAAPGDTVSVTVTGAPGRSFALLGSSVGGGLSHAGVALRVGSDFAILALGVIGSSGQVAVGVTPPFAFSAIDRYYIQAVTSPAPSFASIDASNGRIIRNADLVGNLQGGPSGPPGPQGPPGPPGPSPTILSVVDGNGNVIGRMLDTPEIVQNDKTVKVLVMVGAIPAVLRVGNQNGFQGHYFQTHFASADCSGTAYIFNALPTDMLPPAAVTGAPGAQVLHVAPAGTPTQFVTAFSYRNAGDAFCTPFPGGFPGPAVPASATLNLSSFPAPYRVVQTP